MRARFLGKDPSSQEGQSPTLFATDRTDRKTYIAQSWVVTDPQTLADVGPVPEGEAIIEIPEDVLRFFERLNRGRTADSAHRIRVWQALPHVRAHSLPSGDARRVLLAQRDHGARTVHRGRAG